MQDFRCEEDWRRVTRPSHLLLDPIDLDRVETLLSSDVEVLVSLRLHLLLWSSVERGHVPLPGANACRVERLIPINS